jgi:hypothetical protein
VWRQMTARFASSSPHFELLMLSSWTECSMRTLLALGVHHHRFSDLRLDLHRLSSSKDGSRSSICADVVFEMHLFWYEAR